MIPTGSRASDTELYHFIGKDIINFHGLFWPAMLHSAGLRTPTAIFAHGFLTVNGNKMSKSRGTFINASTYLEHLDAEYLRYYFAAKLSGSVDDIDLNLEDFVQRVNSDVVGKIVNIASRCAGFLAKGSDNLTSAAPAEPELLEAFIARGDAIAELYEQREFNKAMREVVALADQANQYIDEKKPWQMAKQADSAAEVQAVCSMGINLFRVLMTYLKPVLPAMAAKAEAYLGCSLDWTGLAQAPAGPPPGCIRTTAHAHRQQAGGRHGRGQQGDACRCQAARGGRRQGRRSRPATV